MRTVSFAIAVLVSSAAALAQQPRLVNGRLDPQAAGSNLDAAFRRLVAAQTEPVAVPIGGTCSPAVT